MPSTQIVDRAAFAAAAKDGAADGMALRKAFAAEMKAVDVAARTIDFVITTAAVDRMGDSIAVDGWSLDNYMRSPVVLWAHDSTQPPIGKALSVSEGKTALVSRAQFMDRDLSPFADMIFRMYQGGYLSAVSVGFIPTKYAFSAEKGREWGMDFLEQELLEYSCCPIPANPEALISAKAAGIDTAPLREWASRILDEGGSILIPRDFLEETFRAAKTPRSVRQKYLAKADESHWAVGAARDLPTDDADAWDGPAAAKRMLDAAGFDGDAPDGAKAAKGFLIHDTASPALRGSYKLPFADIVDGKLTAVKGGVHAAASRLMQTDAPAPVLDEAKTVLDGYERGFLADKDKTMPLSDDNTPTGTCGRAKSEDCGMKDPAECAVHMPPPDKSAPAPVARAGRKISKVNEALLRDAMDHHDAATKCIKAVLDSDAPDEPDNTDDPASPSDTTGAPLADLTPDQKRAARVAEAAALKAGIKV